MGQKQNVVCEENVRRYYADNPALLAKFLEIWESGKCPFCAPNITNDWAGETVNWNVVFNQFPHKHADGQPVRLHLLVLPKRHIVRLEELTRDEWTELKDVTLLVRDVFPFVSSGCGMAARSDKIGGVTLYHLHFHIIVPQQDAQGTQIPVNFGIG
jgi:diadenosine tetraphosphate (Ap4A) HIT family hydrolase